MSMDLGPILDDLAAGRIDADEANRRIEALKADQTGQTDGDQPTPPTSGLTRVQVTTVRRRVVVEADPSVATLSVEGPHTLRRNGEVMEVAAASEGGFKATSVLRVDKALSGLRDLGLGKELKLRVNPRLVLDAELTAGSLKCDGVPKVGRVRVTGGSCRIDGVQQVADLLLQAGSVTVRGPISQGRSKLKVESGTLTVELTDGANVTVHGQTRAGRLNWPGEDGKVDEVVLGNGAARLDVNVIMGLATIRTEEK